MIDNVIRATFDSCYDFSAKVLYLPKGKPDLLILDSPSDVFPTIDNSADSEYSHYRVRINRQWAESCMNRKQLIEIEFQIFHELRHLHQNASIIRYLETGETGYDNAQLIEAWAQNYTNYIHNDNSGPENLHQYNQQPVERDANAYGLVLLQVLHLVDNVELSLGFPPEAEKDNKDYQNRKEIQRLIDAQTRKYMQASNQKQQPYIRTKPKIGDNDPCPCGSGKKYKKCRCEQYH